MKHLIIGTAGHVDHGKTSLIKMLTGIDCDTHKEEKQRGITINLGFSHLELPDGVSAGIIDVPGHKDFIHTMIGGACGIDLVLLVIAADSGIMPQTTEHLNIITALGIENGIVALSKADLVDEELLEMATLEVTDFLSNTSIADAPIVPVSATMGIGRERLLKEMSAITKALAPRRESRLFRMYIDRIFTVAGFGSVVTGSVLGGSIKPGHEVFLLPAHKQKLKLRTIERHGNQAEEAKAGDRAALNLTGLKREDFERGMLLCDKQLESTKMVDAVVQLFETEIILPVWSNVVFIAGTFECQARMHLLNREKLAGGETAIVQLHLRKETVLLATDKFIIRNSSGDQSLGGGMIMEPFPLHHRRRTAKLIAELEQLANNIGSENSMQGMIGTLLKKKFRAFTAGELAEKFTITPQELTELTDDNIPDVIRYGNGDDYVFVSDQYDEAKTKQTLALLRDYHKQFPLSAEGLDTASIAGKLKADKTYTACLLAKMKTTKAIAFTGSSWIIKGHAPSFDPKSLEDIKWLEAAILDYADNKPVLSEIESRAMQNNISKQKIRSYMAYLAKQGKLRFYQSDFLHSQILEKYLKVLLSRLADCPNGVDIMTFKELLGTKRLRALIVQIAEADGLINMEAGENRPTRLYITQKGKQSLNKH